MCVTCYFLWFWLENPKLDPQNLNPTSSGNPTYQSNTVATPLIWRQSSVALQDLTCDVNLPLYANYINRRLIGRVSAAFQCCFGRRNQKPLIGFSLNQRSRKHWWFRSIICVPGYKHTLAGATDDFWSRVPRDHGFHFWSAVGCKCEYM